MNKFLLILFSCLFFCSCSLLPAGYRSEASHTYLAGDVCMRLGMVEDDVYLDCYNSVLKTLIANEEF